MSDNEIVPLGDRYWWLKQDDPGFKAFIAKTGVDPLKYAQHLENEIFETPPVTMREFLYSPDFCDFKGDLWPKCQAILEEFDDNKYREAYLGLGRGSGKSITGALFLARSVYWLNNLKNPWKYFGLRRNTLLTVINVSISGLQAQSVIFDTLCDIIENGKYFKNKFTKRTALGHADLFFPDKRIKAVSGHSGSTVWRGYAIYAAVADEASWFVTKANKDNAEEIYTVLKGSMQTRFEGRYKLLVISSLKSRNDFMTKSLNTMRKQAKAEKAKGKGAGIEGIDSLCLERGIQEKQ